MLVRRSAALKTEVGKNTSGLGIELNNIVWNFDMHFCHGGVLSKLVKAILFFYLLRLGAAPVSGGKKDAATAVVYIIC